MASKPRHMIAPIPTVTLRLDWKSSSFCLSSVRDRLSNVAWPRLGAHRSGGGKARNQRLHSDALFPGRCQARCFSHAFREGMNGPQRPFLALGEQQHPPLSRLSPGERTHQGGGFSFRSSWKDVTLPKAVEWLPVPSHVERAETSVKRGNVFTHDPSPW
jgi:hypothetical protein